MNPLFYSLPICIHKNVSVIQKIKTQYYISFGCLSSPRKKEKTFAKKKKKTHPAGYNHSFDHPGQSQIIKTQHAALRFFQANQQPRPRKTKVTNVTTVL